MGIVEILVLGLALSMDAFAVTISNTFCYSHESRLRLMLMPLFFGLFQGLMPVLGYFLGTFAAGFIDRFAGIITLVILGFIGGSMIWEGIKALRSDKAMRCEANQKNLTLRKILVQAVATSIDAFAVGVSLLATGTNIALAGPLIALVTCACCVVAIVVGRRFGHLLGDRAQIVGGVVLLAIGIKALF